MLKSFNANSEGASIQRAVAALADQALPCSMGNAFRDVALSCLKVYDGSFGENPVGMTTGDIHSRFIDLVLRRLGQIKT